MRSLAKSSLQLLQTTALLVAINALGTVPARAAEILDGPLMIKAYRIQFDNKTIGKVVVVGCGNLNPPPGYSACREYWTWAPGAAWRGTFLLEPIFDVLEEFSHSWETFPHERFDLSRTVPMPSISPEAGDRFYRVQVRSESGWVDQGWMWLSNGTERRQEWYGRNLTSDLIGAGTAIRFTSAEPPTPGSSEVYLLIH